MVLIVTIRPDDYRVYLDRGYTVFAVVTSSQPKFTISEQMEDVRQSTTTKSIVPRIGEIGQWEAFLFDAKILLSTKIVCEQFSGGQVRRR